MKEKDILFQRGKYWIMKEDNLYYVMKDTITHSKSIACYDRFDFAETYCVYMDSRAG